MRAAIFSNIHNTPRNTPVTIPTTSTRISASFANLLSAPGNARFSLSLKNQLFLKTEKTAAHSPIRRKQPTTGWARRLMTVVIQMKFTRNPVLNLPVTEATCCSKSLMQASYDGTTFVMYSVPQICVVPTHSERTVGPPSTST